MHKVYHEGDVYQPITPKKDFIVSAVFIGVTTYYGYDRHGVLRVTVEKDGIGNIQHLSVQPGYNHILEKIKNECKLI